MSLSRRAVAAFGFLFVACLLRGPAQAQDPGSETLVSPRLVDRIVAIVDEEAILLSDLEREIETYHFEMQTARPIWHGWAEKTVTESDRRDPDAAIREGVGMIFANFPN